MHYNYDILSFLKIRFMTNTVNQKNKQRLWEQLYETMKDRIQQHQYPEESLLPSESELMQEFSVSRVTVRRALDMLQKDGYISRRRGSGTIVLPQRSIVSTIIQTKSIDDLRDCRDRRILSVSLVTAPAEVSDFFNIPLGQKILKLIRVLFSNGKPIAVSHIYLHPVTGFTETDDFSGSIYRKLKDTGYPIVEITDRYSSSLSTEEETKHLALQEPAILVHRTRFGSSEKNQPVECSFSSCLADSHEFIVRIRK